MTKTVSDSRRAFGALMIATAVAATLLVSRPAHADVTQYVFAPAPVASAGSLAPSANTTFSLTASDGTSGVPGATVWLLFQPTTGGGTAFVGTTQLTTVPKSFVTDGSGAIAITYTTPATLPTGGRDIFKAQDSGSTPTITATDSYYFSRVVSYTFSKQPIAIPGSLAPSTTTQVILTAKDATGAAVPGATVQLSFDRTSGGGHARAAGVQITNTFTPFVANSYGKITIKYVTMSSVPPSGTDQINAQDATLNVTVQSHTRYTFGTPHGYKCTPSPIAATGTLAPSTAVPVSIWLMDGHGRTVPDAKVYLSFTPARNGGSASTGGYALSPSPIQRYSDFEGKVLVAYVSSPTPPATGADRLKAQDALSNPTITGGCGYKYA